jgi:hypothetical protein
MTLKVIDRFTTRDGRWEVDSRPYGLTKAQLDKYGAWDIPGEGGAAHIFVKAEPFASVRFFTLDANTPQSVNVTADSLGWANYGMWKSSAYWPPNVGPWHVEVNGTVVATGLGLPEGLHVSTFLIVEDSDEPPDDGPEPIEGARIIQVVVRTWVNGEVIKEEITWQG